MKFRNILHRKQSAYTLIETLVASSVMMVAIGAASSLSLAMVTQEEMSERTVRAVNYLENTAALYQLGFDEAEIASLLPIEPAVFDLSYTPLLGRNVGGLGAIDLMRIRLRYTPSAATSSNRDEESSWTGGVHNKRRAHTIVVFRSQP